MGYHLTPVNEECGIHYMGAFTFPILLEACGYLWPCIQKRAQWYCVFGKDSRMPEGDTYPALISNDQFEVSEFESKVMARVAENYVAVQRSLKDGDNEKDILGNDPWPMKIRTDFVDKIEEFRSWAEKSNGFTIG